MGRRFNTVLPVSESSEGECLVAADGTPVWPLCGSDDVTAVQRIATVFGGSLEWVAASPGSIRHLLNEDVLALGLDAESPGRLYAHLTRRRCRTVENLDALLLTECPSVVVTTSEHLTTDLLDWLYSRSGQPAPGIICGGGGAPLLRQVLVRAAAATLCGPLTVDRTEIFPTVSVSGIPGAGTQILGSEASASERRQALSRGAGVLTVMTHSDGVDAFMGPEFSICARDRVINNIGLPAAPRCGLTDFCHRHETSVVQAIGSGAVFPVDKIAARVFVWDVCFGVMPTGSVVDPGWGIGTRLLESAGIGAILTTWQITLSSPEYAHRVSSAIASGVSVGVAVERFNASRDSRTQHHRMCLLGDPRVQLPRLSVPERPMTRPYRFRHTRVKGPDDIRQISLLRLCMVDAKENASNNPRAAFASRALEAIEAFEAAASKGTAIPALPPNIGHDMRATVLQYALARGKLLENWMPFACSLRASAPSRCPVCRRRADTLHAVMRPPGVTARRLALCPICGVLEDAPNTSDIGFNLDHRTLHLHGKLPRERWAAGILIASSYHADSVQLMWPAMNDGTPALSAELPQKWPPGPVRISVILIWDANFAIISRMARDPTATGMLEGKAAFSEASGAQIDCP